MNPYRILIPFLRPGLRSLAAGICLLILVDFLQLLIPRFIKGVVDALSSGRATTGTLTHTLALIVGVSLLIFSFRFLWRRLIFGQARRIEEALRNRLVDQFFLLSPAFFQRRPIGDLMAHVTNDMEAVRMALGMGLVSLVDSFFLGSAAIGFMIYISPRLTAAALLPMPLVAYLTYRLSRVFHKKFESVQVLFSGLMETVRESLVGILVVKAYNLQPRELGRLSELSGKYLDKNLQLARITGTLFPLSLLLTNLSLAVVIWLGGVQVYQGKITTGDFVAFISYLGMLGWPVMALGWVVNLLKRGGVSLERIGRLLDEKLEIVDRPGMTPPPAPIQKISIHNLSFTYPGEEQPVLKDLNLEIAAGQQILFTGRTGSGKTTLAQLLVRLYDPPQGTVALDGRPIHTIPLGDLRSTVSLVPQVPFLFSDTLRANLRMADPEAEEPQLWEALSLAALDKDVKAFSEGLETVVGEKGVLLSGGQRQRLALARALLFNPPFLILDNTLASVDLSTERQILEALKSRRKGLSTIYISHRLVGLEAVDGVFLFEAGRIVECGRHQALMEQKGLYSRLYQRQRLEKEIQEGVF